MYCNGESPMLLLSTVAAPVVVAAPVLGVMLNPHPLLSPLVVAAPIAIGAVDRRYPWLNGSALSPWQPPIPCWITDWHTSQDKVP